MSGLNLTKPDSFKDDAYGYLTNQISHIWLGMFLPTGYCFILDTLSTYPNQTWAFALTVATYLVWWELAVQGWRGFDTLEDTFYIGVGASIFLYVDMQYVIGRVFAAFLVMVLLLMVGVFFRGGFTDE